MKKKVICLVGSVIVTSFVVISYLGMPHEENKNVKSRVIETKTFVPDESIFETEMIVEESNSIEDSSVSVADLGYDLSVPGEIVNALNAAISSGADVISIPEGDFSCNGQTIQLDRNVSIIGSGKDKTVLKDVGFVCSKGIGLYDLSIDRGVNTKVGFSGGSKDAATVIVYTNPSDSSCRLLYSNCLFSDVDYASFLCSTTEIECDAAYDCTFTNIRRAAIYHSTNIKQSIYKNNVFSNIGSEDISWGVISGIWLGDVTNNTRTQSGNVLIDGNAFKDMYIAEDIKETKHSVNANFISVRADIAYITNNNISDVHGYGQDREGLYTKVRELTVANNVIKDGGFGEGYITCKGQDGQDAYATIINNNISGTYGSGISLYGPGLIQGNTINISQSRIGIVCHSREGETSDNIEINGNVINCEPGKLVLNGQVVESYKPRTVFFADLTQCDLIFTNNTIKSSTVDGGWGAVVDVGNIKKNITIENNDIEVLGTETVGINIHSGEDYTAYNKDCKYTIQNNSIVTNSLGVSIQLKDTDVNTNRKFNISNNTANNVEGNKNVMYVQAGKSDILEYKDTDDKDVTVYTDMDTSKKIK